MRRRFFLLLLAFFMTLQIFAQTLDDLEITHVVNNGELTVSVTNHSNDSLLIPTRFLYEKCESTTGVTFVCSIIDSFECNDVFYYPYEEIFFLKPDKTVVLKSNISRNYITADFKLDFVRKKDLPFWFYIKINGRLSLKRFQIIAKKRNKFCQTLW